jgi:hypothetical protein
LEGRFSALPSRVLFGTLAHHDGRTFRSGRLFSSSETQQKTAKLVAVGDSSRPEISPCYAITGLFSDHGGGYQSRKSGTEKVFDFLRFTGITRLVAYAGRRSLASRRACHQTVLGQH